MTQPDLDSFILLEDAALRDHLKGLAVTDGNKAFRPVGVWFGMPDQEIRSVSYPFLTLDLLNVAEDKTRVQNRFSALSFEHPRAPLANDRRTTRTMFPTPMDLTYQVTSWARIPQHDRSLLSQLNHDRLHPRYASLATSDGVARRLVVESFNKADSLDDKGKRVFKNAWTVTLKSEFLYYRLVQTKTTQYVTINSSGVDRVDPAGFRPEIVYP